MRLQLGVLLAAGVLAGARVEAQVDMHRFTVTPTASFYRPERATSINSGGALGLDALYRLTTFFGVGTTFSYARAQTHGEDFLARLTYGQVSAADTAAVLSRVLPYATGGVGAYGIYLDPQANRGLSHFGALAYNYGAGVNLRFSERGGVRLDVRNVVYTNYRRGRLNPGDGRFVNYQFPAEFQTAPAAKSTVNNLMLSLGFSYTPGAVTSAEGSK
jgi:hypothetical protein